MTEGDRSKKILYQVDELVEHFFIKKAFEDIVAKVTGGDPEKLAKLRGAFVQILDQERLSPSNFDPEIDEIPQDILDQLENLDLDEDGN